jgi:hypothetical protein
LAKRVAHYEVLGVISDFWFQTTVKLQSSFYEWIPMLASNESSARHGHAMATVGSKVFLFGGFINQRGKISPSHEKQEP